MVFPLPERQRPTGRVTRGLVVCGGTLVALVGYEHLVLAPQLWVRAALGCVGLACGWPVLERGLEPLVLSMRPSRDTLPAISASGAFLLSALACLLHVTDRLPEALRRPDGTPVLYLDATLVVLCASQLRRALSPSAFPDELALRAGWRAAVLCATAAGLMAGVGLLWIALGGAWPIATLAALAVPLACDPFLFGDRREVLTSEALRRAERSADADLCPATFPDLGRVDLILFERTGVLTRGQPEIREVVSRVDDRRPEDIARLAAAAEFGARHPLARAILDHQNLESGTIPSVKGFEQIPGEGVRASLQGRELLCGNLRLLRRHGFDEQQLEDLSDATRTAREEGDTVLFVGWNGQAVGWIRLVDPLRPEAPAVLGSLQTAGIRVGVLSGDDSVSVRAVSRRLGDVEVMAGQTPERAARSVRSVTSAGRRAAVVAGAGSGDKALAVATISIHWPDAPDPETADGPTGSARPTSRLPDVRLRTHDLESVPRLIRASRVFRSRLRRALVGTVSYQAVSLALVAGALHPIVGLPPSVLAAGVLHVASATLARRMRS